MANEREFFGDIVKGELKHCGENVKIFSTAKIVKPEAIAIGDYSRIGDYSFIYGGAGIVIGKYVNIAIFSCIVGGGNLIVGDYCVLGYGCRIITGTDTYQEGTRMSGALPYSQRHIVRGKIIIEKDAYLGTNVVVHPNVTIGEGAIIGSNSLVLEDVEPWTINVGSPCKKIKARPRIVMPDL
jgi:acetyltransferase-like isoleucine patch superfamily enzyme